MIELKRNCPKCNCDILYKSKESLRNANKNNSSCRKCSSKDSGFTDRYSSDKNSGSKNPFFGKKHNDISKRNMSLVDKSKYKTSEFKEKMRGVVNRGDSHHMVNSSCEKIWIESFGKEVASEMEACRRKKISDKVSGEKNPMYGKPSPQGSGSGWKGWYKNWFFRSLRELSYVINVIEKNKWTWFSAEKAEFAIKYVFFDNKIRTYFADFVVNEKKLVEVKPIKLHNSPLVLSKTKAAKEFCLKKSFEFEIIDPPMLEYFEISRLLQNNEIKFMEKYEKKFNGMYKETDNN